MSGWRRARGTFRAARERGVLSGLTRVALGILLVAAAFGAGFLVARPSGGEFRLASTVRMHGTPAAPGASALLRIGRVDRGGNRQVILEVEGLPSLRPDGYYELYLTRGHRPAAWVGSFAAHPGVTTVRQNVARELAGFDGWVVAERRRGSTEPRRVVLASF